MAHVVSRKSCRTCGENKNVEEFSIAYGTYRRPHCKTCQAQKAKRDYQINPTVRERRLKGNLDYFYRNRDQLVEDMRTRRAQNPERDRQRSRDYRKNNPETITKLSRLSKLRRRSAIGFFTEDQLRARIDFYGGRCYLCSRDWESLPVKQKHIDHVIPVSRGGTNWPANLRPACEQCNLRKGTKRL
jgi:5-methylcytosine-specific restriction endonuclease McrA